MKECQTLRRDIENLEKPNSGVSGRKLFVPEAHLKVLLSKERVLNVLKDFIPEFHWNEVSELMSSAARKIFSILVTIDHVSGVEDFVKHDQADDHRIPFATGLLEEVLGDSSLAKRFFHEQWKFHAPVFSKKTLWRVLDPFTVLPFLEEKHIASGMFGDIYEVEIEPTYQLFQEIGENKFVRKQFKPNVAFHMYKEELDNLSRLKHLVHPHILPLIGAYTYGDNHNLIFPLARGGDLATFLSGERPNQFKSDEKVFIALVGLASAISYVHKFTTAELELSAIACHRDLRPKNILLDGTRFILADFGISRIKEDADTSGSLCRQGMGYYVAPECQDLDGKFDRHRVGRSSDIWSFGCILAEVLTYLMRGSYGVQEFLDRRLFSKAGGEYYLFHCGRDPNKAVTDWLGDLVRESPMDKKMLIVLINKMLYMDEKKRPKAPEVTDEIRFICVWSASATLLTTYNGVSPAPCVAFDIEKKRFESWRMAYANYHGSTANNEYEESLQKNSASLDLMQCLWDIRAEIEQILCGTENSVDSDRHYFGLRHLTTRLWDSLPSRQQKMARRQLEHRLLVTNDPDDLHKIRELIKNHLAFPKADIALLTDTKRSSILATRQLSAKNSDHSMELLCWPKILPDTLGDHNLGLLAQTKEGPTCKVIIEWKRYDDHISRERTRIKLNAISKLFNSSERSEKLRVLRCRGFYEDENSFAFGLVFEFPPALGTSGYQQNAFSLDSVLRARDRRKKPLLGTRFELASALTSSIEAFHHVQWYHKRLSASNVIFFQSPYTSFDQDMEKPYIVGFAHSRPDELVIFSDGPPRPDSKYKALQHPAYRKDLPYYSLQFDYYSLGIILLEIGLWAHFDDLTQNCQGNKHDFVVQKKVPLVGLSMGSRYQKVVLACLEDDFGGRKKSQDESITGITSDVEAQERFRMLVADPLEDLMSYEL